MTHIETSLTTVRLSLTAAKSGLKDVDEEMYRINQDKNARLTFEQKQAVKDELNVMKSLIKSIETYVE